MRFIPLKPEEQQPTQLRFIPLQEEKAEAKPAAERVYQDVAEPSLTSPEEMLTAPPSPKTKSVMEGYVPTTTGDTRMELPSISTEARRLYDAATPEQRSQLVKKDPVFKQIDEVYRLQDERARAELSKRSGIARLATDPYIFDTRAEHRKESLIKQGLDPELAETTARRMAYSGIESKRQPYGEVKESPAEYAMAEDLRLRPGMAPAEQALQVVKRGGTQAFVGLGQAGAGMRLFIDDVLGLDSEENQERLASMERFSQAMGQPASKPVAIFEGAINSIAQQVPALVAGAVTGSEPLVLASMFANSFGQTYDESRRKDLDVGAATARSAAYAAFEVLGERFGLKEQLAGIKAAASKVPTKDVAEYFAKALVKEVPGEQLTYAGQFAVDKGFGMNPEAGIKAFIEGAVDTVAATVVQGGMMMGGGAATNKLIKSIAKERPEVVASMPDALEIARSKGFLPEKKPEEKEKRTGEKETTEEAEVTTAYKQAVARFQRQGYTPADAIRFAEQELEDEGYGPDEIRLGRSELGISVPSGADVDTGVTDESAGAKDVGVAGAGEAADGVGARAGLVDRALDPFREELVKTYGDETANQIIARAAELVTDGALPEAAVRDATTEVTEVVEETGRKEVSEAIVVPPGFAYRLTESPAYEGTTPLSVDDAITELKFLLEQANRNRLTPENFSQSEIGKRLDTGQVTAVNNAIRTDPIKTIQSLIDNLESRAAATTTTTEPAAAPAVTPPAATTELQPPGKKASPGRPKTVLTPEQKTAKQEQRKLSQAASRDAGRTVEKATKVIDEPFDIGAFPDEDTAKAAQETRDAEVIEALVEAIRVANDPRFRKNKPGQQALALIERFPPDSRIRQIAEARARIGEPSKSLTTTTNEHDPDMGSLNDAQSLLGYIKTFGTAFEKVLAARLRPLLKGVRVVHVTDPNTDIPSGKARRSFKGALGMFYNKVVYLNANPDESGQNNETALHESLHGATVDVVERYYTDPASLTTNQLTAMVQLERIRDDAYKHYEAMVDRAEADPAFAEENKEMLAKMYSLADPEGPNVFGDLKEFVTYGMTQPEFQEFLMSAPGEFDPKSQRTIGLFTQFVQAIRKILNMGPEHMSALQDLIIVTDRLVTPIDTGVRTATPAPALARSTKNLKKSAAKVDKDLQKIQASLDANTVTDSTGATIPERGFTKYMGWLNARYEDMAPDFLRNLLYTMQTVDILRWKGDQIPGLVDVDKIQQQMVTMKNSLLEASAKQADKLAAFVRKNGLQTISSTMHLARLKRVNPTEFATLAEAQQKDPVVVHYDKILTDANYRAKHNINATLSPKQITAYENKRKERQANLKIVYDSWDKLGKQKNGHEMYIMVRQFYKDNYLAYRAILDDQINALPIDAAAKARLLKSVRLMQEQAKGAPDPDYDGMTLKQMPEEYFPFKRHGDYWLRVTKGPTGREFYAFDSASERNKFLQIRAKQLGKDPKDGDEFAAGDDIRSLREDFSTDSAMLQQMFAAINEAEGKGQFDPAKYKKASEAKAAFDAYREELKDQLYQTYLLTLPERSFRKQFLHSENVTGFSADILRNFKQSANAYANQLAKLKYSNDIRNQIQRAKDSLEGAEPLERAKLEAFIEVIERRANEEMNPPEPNRVANFVNQFSFLWLLTAAATSMVQLVSIPVFVMPTLSQRYGYGKAGKEFTRYAAFFKTYGYTKKLANGDVEYTAPSVGSSAMVRGNPVLQRAFQAALDRGVTTLTNTSVLTNRNRTPENAYESIPGVAARTSFNIMTALFNGGERISREITYMMTFKLEYEKTGDFNKSVDVAVDAVHELLGRYDNFNRPDILRNFIGKTVGQFKMYAIFVTSWFTRNGYTAFTEGMGKKEGRAALERLVGVLVMGGLFHGTVGQPLYSTICTVIDAVLDGLDDEEEKQRRRAANPYTSESSNLRFRYEFLPRHFGHIEIPGIDGRNHRLSEILEKGPISVFTDMNVGSRTSYDGIWFREGKVGKNATETIQNYILENLGPGVSTMMNFVGGVEDFNNGDIQRGLEKTAPAFFKAPLIAYRLSQEGAETRGGDKMLKRAEVNDLNLISATLGFQPSRLARIQEHNFAMDKEKIAAERSKTEALKDLNEALYAEKGDKTDVKNAFDKIKKHNKRYPVEGFTIDSDTIDRSMESYEEAKGLTYRGLRMSEKTAPFLLPSAAKAAPVPPKEDKLKFVPLKD